MGFGDMGAQEKLAAKSKQQLSLRKGWWYLRRLNLGPTSGGWPTLCTAMDCLSARYLMADVASRCERTLGVPLLKTCF